MSAPTLVTVPLENVNDESVVVLAWRVADGERVEKGQTLVEIETSKANVTIEAPVAGHVRRNAREGQEIAIGAVICFIGDTADVQPAIGGNGAAARPAPAPAAAPPAALSNGAAVLPVPAPVAMFSAAPAEAPPTYTGPARFSARARQLLASRGLSADAFPGRGLVREADVLAYLDPTPRRPAPPPAPAKREDVAAPRPAPRSADASTPAGPVAGVPCRTEPLPRRKRLEAKHLAAGQAHTLPSGVVVACPTRGLRAAARAHTRIQGNATAILVFEIARLLRRYPELNAFCAGDSVVFYDEVNVGFAVDAERGLKVPVIRRADEKTIVEIADEMADLLVAYLGDTLSVESLAGGTFTLTDLSGEGIASFTPLINRGQSAILGVGGEVFAPGSSHGFYNLILSFDHQLAEGRSAARFLNELKDRLAAYEEVLLPAEPAAEAPAAEPLDVSCSRCFRPAEELAALPAYLIPTMRADGSTKLLCTVCLQGL
jgi:pyruvate/2-oxoglutarate dehydrogenase complex dihydrolipoamide acyltransferase (E2) component